MQAWRARPQRPFANFFRERYVRQTSVDDIFRWSSGRPRPRAEPTPGCDSAPAAAPFSLRAQCRGRTCRRGGRRTTMIWLLATFFLIQLSRSLPACATDAPQPPRARPRRITLDLGGRSRRVLVPPAPGATGNAVATTSSATPQWLDGEASFTQTVNCISGDIGEGIGAITGYYGTLDETEPAVGDIYYARVIVAAIGDPCTGGFQTDIEYTLPPHTQLAVSTQTPIYCYVSSDNGQTFQQTSDCSQDPQVGYYGYTLDPISNPTWPMPPGYQVEVHVPVTTDAPLNGNVDDPPSQQFGPAWGIDGVANQWAYPTMYVWVAPSSDIIFQSGFEN
jgi:hypothetical protein